MTTKRVFPSVDAGGIVQFPEAPPDEMTAYHHVNFPAYPASLAAHFGNRETTVILSEIAAALILSGSYEGVRFPDLLIAFDANPDAIIPRNGYLIPEQGKPPDFVLEVASESTALKDETVKRVDYAAMGISEYWRFDPSGGNFHSTHLAGDRLVEGEYQPIPIRRTAEGHFRGHSDVLNLDLRWEGGELRFWDPVEQLYLTTYLEEHDARLAERNARLAERDARLDAEARAQLLEEELRSLREG